MVDNRSAGVLGIGGGINFKSGDISGTAAKTSDDRASQGTEYFLQEEEQQGTQNNNGAFQDRSMQLRASLNSLALLNVAYMLQNKKKSMLLDEDDVTERIKAYRVEEVTKEDKEHSKK